MNVSPPFSLSASANGELIRGLHNLRSRHWGNVVTIGSFDGVHLGHQAIIKQVLQQSAELQLPSTVMIFEPQPHEYFAGEKAPARLQSFREKVFALFSAGVNRICCLPFNHHLSQQSSAAFIEQVLVNGLGVRYLVVGDDFRFGAGRQGDYTQLQQAGQQYGFTVTDTASYLVNEERVSSTRIRALLQENAFSCAAQLLGRPYTIGGRVVKGQQLGRQLGVPTANVHLRRFRSPLSGVFAVVVTLADGTIATGVANVGVRPTLGGDTKPLLEVHLLNRSDDLYGQFIEVEFKHKLREERRFENVQLLQQQILRDVDTAKHFFEQHPTD